MDAVGPGMLGMLFILFMRRTLGMVVLATAGCTVAAAQSPVKIEADVVYGHKDGLALTCDVYRPAAEADGPALLFMVSGGWYSAWRPAEQALPMFAPLVERGFTVFAVRHGSSPRYGIVDAVADVRRCVRFVRHHAERFGIDPDRIGVYGMSAGGHLSLMLGTTGDDGDASAADPLDRVGSRVQAVCAFVAPTDLRPMAWSDPKHHTQYDRFPALDITQDVATAMSPLLAASADDAPTLLIAGDKDELVPIWHSERMHAALTDTGATVKFVPVRGAGHAIGGKDLVTAVAEMVAFFETHLAAP
jgi:acetyl esterase/lipase